MAGSKKPRKRYNPNRFPVHVPMQSSTRDNISLELHLAIEGLILAPSDEGATLVTRMLATMANAINYGHAQSIRQRTDESAIAVRNALDTMEAIEARYDRLGKVGISGDEAQTLRAASAGLDKSLARIPHNILVQSIAAVSRVIP
jgi:hypothetical protein